MWLYCERWTTAAVQDPSWLKAPVRLQVLRAHSSHHQGFEGEPKEGGRKGRLSLSPTQFSGRLLSDGRTVTQSGWHWAVSVKRSSCTFIYNRTSCTMQSLSDQFTECEQHLRWRRNEILLLALSYHVFVWQEGKEKKPWDVADTLIFISLFQLT